MAIALSIVALAFAAFCVWLTARIVNRRENSDDEFLVAACFAAVVLLLVVVSSISLYFVLQQAIRPKPGTAKTKPIPPPVRSSANSKLR